MPVNLFKRISPEQAKSFIPFNRNTRGISGRAVYIDPQLIPRYIELINSKAVLTPMRLDAAIQGLRAQAGGYDSSSSSMCAFCHRLQVDGVEISYSILQDVSPKKKSGVYVTDLRVRSNVRNADSAGLHLATPHNGRWRAVKSTTHIPITYNGVIASGTKTGAGEASLLNSTIGAAQLVKTKTGKTPRKFDMFFAPSSQIDSFGTWVTPAQKRLPTNKLAANLAKVIQQMENSSHTSKITWHVSDEGAEVLRQALKVIRSNGVNTLRRQDFTFNNPLTPISSLKLALQNVGIDLPRDMIDLSSSNNSSRVTQLQGNDVGLAFKSERTRLSKSDHISAAPQALANTPASGIFIELAKKALQGVSQGWA